MIYEVPAADAPLSQGDILERCPLVYWTTERDQQGVLRLHSASSDERVIVLTQSCDLANTKTSRVQVAVVHATGTLVREGILKPQTIRDQVRRHRVFGWYFLPAGDENPESIVDLHDLHTIPRELLEEQVRLGLRKTAVSTPYREHLAQHFSTTFSRIALPEPYESLPEWEGGPDRSSILVIGRADLAFRTVRMKVRRKPKRGKAFGRKQKNLVEIRPSDLLIYSNRQCRRRAYVLASAGR